MRKGRLSWLYTAWLIIISFAINDVKSVNTTEASTSSASAAEASTSSASATEASTTLASATEASTSSASTTEATTSLASTAPTTSLPPPSGAKITTVTALNSTSLQVTWETVPDTNGTITGYTVCYSLNSPVTCSNNKTVDRNTLSTSIAGLDVFTPYYVAVKASTAAGDGPLGAKMKGTTGQGAPPSGAKITAVTALNSTSLQVTWETVADTNGPITGYTVCYSLNTPVNCSNNKTVDTDTLNTIIAGLNVFRKYYVAVKASTAAGDGTLGGVMERMTGQAAPSSGAKIINVTALNSMSLQVTWESVSSTNGPITNYTVCYSLISPVACSNKNQKTVDKDTLSTSITGLNVFTKYYVAVKASTAAGDGPLGGKMKGTTNEAKPAKGATVTMVIPVSSTALEVTWEQLHENDTNGNITAYRVCYSTQQLSPGSCPEYKVVVGVDNTMFNLTGLNEATEYFVAVQARTQAGFGPNRNNLNNMTLEAKPAEGPNIRLITPSPTKLEITWIKLSVDDSNGEIIRYEVCYQLGSTVPNCTANKMVSSDDNTTDVTGLTPATLYTVAVRAFTKVGNGPLGERMNATTLESAPAKGATVTMVIPVSSTSLEVTWKKLQESDTNGIITEYRVCYSTQQLSPDSCPEHKAVVEVDNTTFNLTGLNETTLYFVAVQAGTRAGFGPNENILNGTTFEDEPVIGPNIRGIVRSARKLEVTWNKLNMDDSNGVITKYEVCYALGSAVSNCSTSNIVTGVDNTRTDITVLTPATLYTVAVRASTKVGYGPLGESISVTTDESVPSPPIIDRQQITSGLTTIALIWSQPSQPNGSIKKYKVCWHLRGGSPSKCYDLTTIPKDMYTIVDLNPGTAYDISVSAFTSVGEGRYDKVQGETVKSALGGEVKPVVTSNVAVSDTKTQIGFTLPNINPGEIGKILRFDIIVKRWYAKDNTNTFRGTPQNDLKHFNESANGMKAYIAITKDVYENNTAIIVGNNRKTTTAARRKRRNVNEYLNAPLIEDTQYAIFIRVFYSKDRTSFQSSDVLVKKTSPPSTGGNGTDPVVIVIVVIVVIVFILVAVFGVLLFRRRKPQRNYDGINLETTAKPVVRYPIAIAEFRAHCERLGMNTGLGYQEEYESVRPKGQVSTEIAKRQENVDKNRYNNIHAYDDTRVVLSQLDGEEGSDYINANHIDGFERKNQFIAAQGTLKNTIVDFWRMIWEQKVSSIVMLANPIEKGREKLAVYWPQDRAVKHGPFMIKLDGEVELADYVIRKMTVTQDDIKETRQLTQFHYTVWPDHGVPLYTTSLQAFLTRIRKIVKDDSNPLVVHCSAGVGRTGTFIGIFAMLDMIESTQTVDIFNFVCQMRAQRTHMVQVESQYVFLHKAVLEAIECGDTEINAPDLRVKMIKLNRADPDNPDDIMMGTQFKVLEKYTFVKSNTEEGKKSFNVDKNRNKDILPYEDTRVSLLKSPGVDGSDYINASSIDSYQVRGMYIATQFPLENTVNEFWRMMWEKKSNCIVMLANDDENPDLFKKYWTDKSNDAMLCGNLLVTLDNEEKNEEFVIRNFKLKKNEGGETRDIWHFNFLSWTEDQVPKTTEGIRQMIGKIQDVQRQGGNNPIVVHCSDGSGRTGAFCALVTSLERVKQDQSFNLFQTIMLQRIQRPRMVASVEQYKFCFQAILDFLDSFDQYANFQDLRQ